MINLFV